MDGSVDVGRQQVKQGWAKVGSGFARKNEYRKTQKKAKKNGLGVWGLCGGF